MGGDEEILNPSPTGGTHGGIVNGIWPKQWHIYQTWNDNELAWQHRQIGNTNHLLYPMCDNLTRHKHHCPCVYPLPRIRNSIHTYVIRGWSTKALAHRALTDGQCRFRAHRCCSASARTSSVLSLPHQNTRLHPQWTSVSVRVTASFTHRTGSDTAGWCVI
jgi:hypothetical protein